MCVLDLFPRRSFEFELSLLVVPAQLLIGSFAYSSNT